MPFACPCPRPLHQSLKAWGIWYGDEGVALAVGITMELPLCMCARACVCVLAPLIELSCGGDSGLSEQDGNR